MKKILILGTNFNKFSGGGITLFNLFKGYPVNHIGVACENLVIDGEAPFTEFFNIGYPETKRRVPFNFFQNKLNVSYEGNINLPTSPHPQYFLKEKSKGRNLKTKIKQLYIQVLNFTGLYHYSRRIIFTSNFEKWYDNFKPDIIYTQLSSIATIELMYEICTKKGTPFIIHFMDNWLDTLGEGMMSFYYKPKTDRLMKYLISKAENLMAISTTMAEEYEIRYKRAFSVFHNPIDLDFWDREINVENSASFPIKILYAGRIGLGNLNAIKSFGALIELINSLNFPVEFYIQSMDIKKVQSMFKNKNIKALDLVKYEELPKRFREFDALLIPIDSKGIGYKFIKYSMPTKVSEYMITKRVVIAYTPRGTAVEEFISSNSCGIVLDNSIAIAFNAQYLINALKDFNCIKKICNNAYLTAKDKQNSNIESSSFQKLFCSN